MDLTCVQVIFNQIVSCKQSFVRPVTLWLPIKSKTAATKTISSSRLVSSAIRLFLLGKIWRYSDDLHNATKRPEFPMGKIAFGTTKFVKKKMYTMLVLKQPATRFSRMVTSSDAH